MGIRSFSVVTQKISGWYDRGCVAGREHRGACHKRLKKTLHRVLLISLTGIALVASAASATAPPATAPTYSFNIPRQPADDALPVFGKQADITVIYPFDRVANHSTNRLVGTYSVTSAVAILFKNTGLFAHFTSEGHLVISEMDYSKGKNMNTTKKSLLAAMVGLFAAGGMGTVQAQEQVGESARAQGVLDEIIITASRRDKSLNDTAISVAAIGGEEIARRNLSEMNDYLRTVPGVNYVEIGVGRNTVVTRGVAIDPQIEGALSSVSTGVYFDEVSLGGLTSLGGSSDLKMIDLQRVEVLRGPQGTLFGSGALAGAIRNIPNAPDLNELRGNIKTSYSATAENGGDNTKFEGVINIPIIEDELAIRAVAYRHDTSGYIDNIAGTVLATNGFVREGVLASDAIAVNGGAELYQDESDVGAATHEGGRIAVLWAPTDNLNATLTHIYQDTYQNGEPYVELGIGAGYEQTSLQFGNDEGLAGERAEFVDTINITNLVLDYDLGWASLLSSSAWMDGDAGLNRDESSFGGRPIPILVPGSSESFSQELRLTSKLEGSFQYVVGAYYEEIETDIRETLWSSTDETADIFGRPFGDSSKQLNRNDFSIAIDQLSYYGELSYRFSDQLELTLGARRFDYERSKRQIGEGLFGNFDIPSKFDESGTSYKANVSYTPNEDTLIYAQWAEGFRLGNTNSPINRSICDVDNDGILDGTVAPITDGFDSDTTENFELGMKLGLLDNQLQVNAAVYRMDWEGIPLFVFPQGQPLCFQGITANLGEARSQGLEIESTYQITPSLRANLGGAYTNAELTEDVPSLGFSSGDRLPSSPGYSMNVGLHYEFDISSYASYVQGDYAYVSEFYNKPAETGVELGDYGQLNISAGIAVNAFSVELFVHNVANEDALTHADTNLLDNRAFRLRPRTIGLNVGYQF
jgi:iron complex outermembrane receptor protein